MNLHETNERRAMRVLVEDVQKGDLPYGHTRSNHDPVE